MAVNIFFREAQQAWEELFPFADNRTLKLAAEHGLPDDSAKLAELVDNDRHKYVRLLLPSSDPICARFQWMMRKQRWIQVCASVHTALSPVALCLCMY